MIRFALVLLIAVTSLVPQGLCTCRAICASLGAQYRADHVDQDEEDHCGCFSHNDGSSSDIDHKCDCDHSSPCGKKGEHHHTGCFSIIQKVEPATFSFSFDLAILHDCVGELLVNSKTSQLPVKCYVPSSVGSAPLFVLNCSFLI